METQQGNDSKIKGLWCRNLNCLMCNDPVNEECVLEQQLLVINFVHQRLGQILKNRVEEGELMNEIIHKMAQLTRAWAKKLNSIEDVPNEG